MHIYYVMFGTLIMIFMVPSYSHRPVCRNRICNGWHPTPLPIDLDSCFTRFFPGIMRFENENNSHLLHHLDTGGPGTE